MPAATHLYWKFIIGGVELKRQEVPEEFKMGFEQDLVVHRFLAEDGAVLKKTHKFGAFPVDTKWSGILYGITALSRFQTLEALAQSTHPVPFEYGPLKFTVDVESCVATVRHQLEIHYDISLIVLTANHANTLATSTGPNLDVRAQSFFDSGKQAGDQVLTMPATIPVPSSVQETYTGMIAQMVANWPLTQLDISGLLNVSSSTLAYINAAQDFINTLRAMQLSSDDTGLLQNMLASFTAFSGIKNLVSSVLNNTTQAARSISVQAGNVFQLAAQFYPNTPVDQAADMLVTANGLQDHFITTPTDLVLPPLS